jgi:hypothetical protein
MWSDIRKAISSPLPVVYFLLQRGVTPELFGTLGDTKFLQLLQGWHNAPEFCNLATELYCDVCFLIYCAGVPFTACLLCSPSFFNCAGVRLTHGLPIVPSPFIVDT